MRFLLWKLIGNCNIDKKRKCHEETVVRKIGKVEGFLIDWATPE